ncbi:MAG: YcnI family protein [Actinomycetota bacterium]
MTAAVLAGGLAAALAVPAEAHVTLNPREAPKGGRARFDIRVPNERPDASTVKVEVQMPDEHVFPTVRVLPVAGWTYTISKKTLATPIKEEDGEITEAVASITWQGGTIKPDEFMEFPISMGPLPTDADELRFKSIQTYSSGEVVRWIEVPEAGRPEPEHPAPVVKLVAATSEAAPPASPAAATGESATPGAGGVAAFALVLAILAVIRSMGALMAARNRNKPPAG